jgi:hypothetical protein
LTTPPRVRAPSLLAGAQSVQGEVEEAFGLIALLGLAREYEAAFYDDQATRTPLVEIK